MIREMNDSDRQRIIEIYEQGIAEGTSTFNTSCPTYEEWDKAHLKECRCVYEDSGTVQAFIALSPVSSRKAYSGVAEISLYIDKSYRYHGIGKIMTDYICKEAEKHGFRSLLAVIFEKNAPSIALIKKCGFREIGYRERIAKDKFGNWQNTVMFEKRLNDPE